MKANYPDGKIEYTSGVDNLEKLDPKDLAEANRRFEVLQHLVYRRGDAQQIADAVQRLGIKRSQIYELIADLRRDFRPLALMPKKPGRTSGLAPLPPHLEKVVREAIDNCLRRQEDLSFVAIRDSVRAACHRNKLTAPGEKHLRQRIKSIPDIEIMAMRHGKTIARRIAGPKMGHHLVETPLAQIQIDHTKLDLMIVDDVSNTEIGRPWLTLVIDVYSRAILAFHLSLEPPASKTLGLVLAMAVWPKKNFLDDRNIEDVDWPMYGLPLEIFVDNGPDMRSAAFEKGCAAYNIKLSFRRDVHAGGIIERLIGTISRRVHTLPGTTGSNVSARKNYDSQGNAFLSIWDAERWLVYEIQRYHNVKHKSLCISPAQQWAQGIREMRAKVDRLGAISQRQFFISFLPFAIRKVHPDGIALFGERYVGEVLASRLGESVEIRYNSGDHRYVYVQDGGGKFYSATNVDPSQLEKPRSFEELRRARRARVLIASDNDGQNVELKSILAQEKVVSKSRTLRRREQSRRRHRAEHLVSNEAPALIDSQHAEQDFDLTQPVRLLKVLP